MFLKSNLFYASFIPGLQNLIEEAVKERLTDVKIHRLLDGAILFETETSYDKLNFFCFNNIFAVINVMEHSEDSHALEKHVTMAIGGRGNAPLRETAGTENIIANNSKNFHTFRIVFSNENKPASIDEKLRVETEKYISRLSNLKVNRSLPDTEFWFLFRRESNSHQRNFSVFMKRLTLRPSWEKTLHKGELPPPLAWTLCRLARLSHTDSVLDPFCGYGSIPDTALKHFHITNFTACDNNREAVLYTADRFKKRKNSGFVLHQADFSSLPSLVAEKSIDAIVTDPPWGQFREINDNAFHEKMFAVFEKLLKDGGRAVVLYANGGSLVKALPESFYLQDSIPILLSGKKAVIFQFYLKGNSHGGTETQGYC